MIDTILFDLDNTLLDFNKAERIAIQKTLCHIGIEPKDAILNRYSEINLAQWKLLEQGKLTRSEVKVRRYRLLFDELGVDFSPREATAIYESFLGQGHYFMDGAQDLLHALTGRFRLYLVTNGTAAVQKGRIQSAGLKRYFNDMFISENVGYPKPDLRYFTYCFAHIPDFQKEQTIIVGDSLTSDIQGGKNAGIRTVWFHPKHVQNNTDLLPDYEISHLSELPALLQKL